MPTNHLFKLRIYIIFSAEKKKPKVYMHTNNYSKLYTYFVFSAGNNIPKLYMYTCAVNPLVPEIFFCEFCYETYGGGSY